MLCYVWVFQYFRVSAAVRPHHQAISARAQEKGAVRSDLGQTKACARPPVKKGRTAAPGPKTRRPIRDSEKLPERGSPSTTEIRLSGESALFKLASISRVSCLWGVINQPGRFMRGSGGGVAFLHMFTLVIPAPHHRRHY